MSGAKGKERANSALLATAYHEAGHAVASWRLNIGLRRAGVTIVPDQAAGSLGSSSPKQVVGRDIEWNASDKNIRRAENKVQSLLAGGIAQRRYNPRSARHFHSRSDREQAIDVLMCVAGSEREIEAWLKLLYIRTEQMFANPDIWRAVERLARELIERRTISGKEVIEIISDGFNESFYSMHPEARSREQALAGKLKALSAR